MKRPEPAPMGMYEIAFGAPDGTFIALTGDPSMSAITWATETRSSWLLSAATRHAQA